MKQWIWRKDMISLRIVHKRIDAKGLRDIGDVGEMCEMWPQPQNAAGHGDQRCE
jgi:hypothetical protein